VVVHFTQAHMYVEKEFLTPSSLVSVCIYLNFVPLVDPQEPRPKRPLNQPAPHRLPSGDGFAPPLPLLHRPLPPRRHVRCAKTRDLLALQHPRRGVAVSGDSPRGHHLVGSGSEKNKKDAKRRKQREEKETERENDFKSQLSKEQAQI